MQALYNEAKWLNASDWTVFAGLSDYLAQPVAPPGFADTARAKALGTEATYGYALLDTPVAITEGTDGWVSVKLPKTLFDPGRMTFRPAYLLERRADLVWDDAAELDACLFPNTDVAVRLTPGTRRQVYGGPIFGIKPPESGPSSGGFFDDGSTFMAAAAEKATYDAADQWAYYPKWLKKNPAGAADRVFGFDRLSDRYLQLNFHAFDLQKDAVYLILRIGGDRASALLRLYQDNTKPSRPLRYEAMNVHGMSVYGDTFAAAAEYLKRLAERSKTKVSAEAWFFYAIGGPDQPPSFFAKPAPTVFSMTSLEQVVDPQHMVQSIRGLGWHEIENERKNWSARTWLKDLVRLRFSEPWVWFWNNAHIQMFYGIDREALFLREIRAAEKAAVGGLKVQLRKFREAAERDKTLHLVRRGSTYGGAKRVVGSDDAYVYLYDNHRKLLTRLPMYAFWKSLNISMISTVIYNNTRGMIPIAKAITWAGVAVMGWAVIGTATLVNGFRMYVQERIRGIVVDKVLEKQFRELRDRVLLSLLNPLLALIPTDGPDSTSKRAFAFFKGFIQGYTHDSFVAMFKRWESLAKLEPAALRSLKLMMKIESVLRMVDEKISAVKAKVDAKTAKLLTTQVGKAFTDATTGIIGIVNNLYFLEYDRVKSCLQVYVELTGEKMPTAADWDKLRHKHLLETFREYEAGIRKEQVDLADLYGNVRTGLTVLQRAVQAAEGLFILNVASGGLLTAMVMFALAKGGKVAVKVAAAAGGAVIIGSAVNDKFRAEVWETLKDIGSITAKGLSFILGTTINPARMERLGQLVGQLWGGITLNKTVFGPGGKTWTERWRSKKSYKSFVTKDFLKSQLSVSPFLPIIKLALFNYVFLIEKVVADSKKAWDQLEDKLETALLGDPAFRDIFEEDKELTLAKILEVIAVVDEVLTAWLKKLGEEPELAVQVTKVADLLQKISPAQLPTFKMLRDGTFPDGGWSRAAVLFVMLSHLQCSLRFIVQAIEAMHTPIKSDDPELSIAFVLGLLGFQQSESEVLEILDRNFDETFKDAAQPVPAAAP